MKRIDWHTFFCLGLGEGLSPQEEATLTAREVEEVNDIMERMAADTENVKKLLARGRERFSKIWKNTIDHMEKSMLGDKP